MNAQLCINFYIMGQVDYLLFFFLLNLVILISEFISFIVSFIAGLPLRFSL